MTLITSRASCDAKEIILNGQIIFFWTDVVPYYGDKGKVQNMFHFFFAPSPNPGWVRLTNLLNSTGWFQARIPGNLVQSSQKLWKCIPDEKSGSAIGLNDHCSLALGDRFWLFIQTLNSAKKHSIQLFIQRIYSLKKSKLFIQM